MDEMNPYESPKTTEPVSLRKVTKRSIGVTAIIWLTPVAVGIATLASCGFIDPVVNRIADATHQNYTVIIPLGIAAFLMLPTTTFF